MMLRTTTPWAPSDADIRFRKTSAVAITAGLATALIISLVPLPAIIDTEDRRRPRLAEIILPPPEPIVPPVVERSVVTPPEPAERKPEPRPEVVEEKPEVVVAEVPQTVKQAKEKARSSGLLAFQDQLQAMRDQVDDSNLQDTAALSRGSGEAAELQRSIITSNEPGDCSKCGMALEMQEGHDHGSHDHGEAAAGSAGEAAKTEAATGDGHDDHDH